MKIIKRGCLDKEKEYMYSCPNCGCEFMATRKELHNYSEYANDERLGIKCPEDGCGTTVYTSPEFY